MSHHFYFSKLPRYGVIGIFSFLLAGLVCAQGVSSSPKASQPSVNALLSAATNVGIKQCLPAIQRLSSLAIRGTRGNDVLLDWDRTRGDSSPVFSLIGMEYANAGAAMSVTAVPDMDGGCSVSAERISVAPYTCQSVAVQELVGYQVTKLLPNFSVYVDGKDPNSSVSLIDSAPGCLIVRRYVAFGWKNPGSTVQLKK